VYSYPLKINSQLIRYKTKQARIFCTRSVHLKIISGMDISGPLWIYVRYVLIGVLLLVLIIDGLLEYFYHRRQKTARDREQ